jgi:predicted nuclease of restriction endonuclease-like RecB superfamily
MLTGSLARVRFSRDLIIPQYVDARELENLAFVQQVVEVVRDCEGKSRGEMEQELADVFGDDPGDYFFRGLVKLLDNRCEFATVAEKPPDEVREQVFAAADVARRAATFDREAILTSAAAHFGMNRKQIEDGLFADLKSEQRLIRSEPTTAERLLERYNLDRHSFDYT